MNHELIDLKFSEMPEVEVMRLMTCGFSPASFSLIKDIIPPNLALLGEKALKHSSQLSNSYTTYKDLVDKLTNLDDVADVVVTTNAINLLSYPGVTLDKSLTLLSTPKHIVSYNEQSYYICLYPWAVEPVNPIFKQFKQSSKKAFFHTKDFNLALLEMMDDVDKVSNGKIYLKDKTILPIVEV